MATNKASIKYRREKVKELMLAGLSIPQLCKELNVNQPTISRDIKEIRKELMKDVEEDGLAKAVTKYILVSDKLIYLILKEQTIKSLYFAKNLLKERIEILQSLGLLPSKPPISITEVTNYAVKWIESTGNTIQTTEMAKRISQEQ